MNSSKLSNENDMDKVQFKTAAQFHYSYQRYPYRQNKTKSIFWMLRLTDFIEKCAAVKTSQIQSYHGPNGDNKRLELCDNEADWHIGTRYDSEIFAVRNRSISSRHCSDALTQPHHPNAEHIKEIFPICRSKISNYQLVKKEKSA